MPHAAIQNVSLHCNTFKLVLNVSYAVPATPYPQDPVISIEVRMPGIMALLGWRGGDRVQPQRRRSMQREHCTWAADATFKM